MNPALPACVIPDGNAECVLSHTERTIPSDTSRCLEIVRELEAEMNALHVEDEDAKAVQLAATEALFNAVQHGNRGDESRSIRICWKIESDEVFLEIEDEGNGFTPDEVPDPRAQQNLTRPGGRGVLMIQHLMTHVEFNARGNCVRMTKRLNCSR